VGFDDMFAQGGRNDKWLFIDANAGDLGYILSCYGDYASAEGFNPKMRMIRTKTLMQGSDCCNHRYVIEG
jgi:hypothetical protein